MRRRLLSVYLLLLALHICCGVYPALAQSAATAGLPSALVEPASPAADQPQSVFKSGVKYDPVSHQWRDRYNGKAMDLGLPGVADRYGAQNVIADNTVIAANGPGSGSGGPANSSFWNFKTFFIGGLLGLGVATAIVVPIVLGVGSHNAHNNNPTYNQTAVYYFFHNQTISPPHFFVPPPHIFHSGEKPPPPPPPTNSGRD